MKNGLTHEQHKLVAGELKVIRTKIMDILTDICPRYRKNSSHIRRLFNALNQIEHVRSEMEELLFQEHRGYASIELYYGRDLDKK